MTLRAFVLAVSAAVLLMATMPSATAHAAAPPPEYITRVLHDCNDDWLGHSASGAHGHDLIALDLREAWDDAAKQDVMIFRLIMNGGFGGQAPAPVHRAHVTFKAAGADMAFDFTTADNTVWTGTFPTVAGPFPQLTPAGAPDGARFYVEGTVSLADLGVAPGDTLGTFFVQGYAGDERADHMTGGSTLNGQEQQGCPLGPADDAVFARPALPIAGPTHYAQLAADTDAATVAAGDNFTVTLTVRNLLFEHAQNVTVSGAGPANVDLAFHATDYQPDRLTISMDPDTEAIIHMYIEPSTGSKSGTVNIDLTTSLGGHVLQSIALTIPVEQTMPTNNTTAPPTTDAGAEDIPGPAAPVFILALATVAFISRRRVA